MTFEHFIDPLPYVIAILAGMSISLLVGRRIGYRWYRQAEGKKPTFGSVEGAIFALYGLLMAFTFSGAPDRLEKRAYYGADEVNAIGTAYLRLDLLPAEARPAIKQKFRDYVDSRIATYQKFPDIEAAEAEMEKSIKLQSEIWTDVVAAAEKPGSNPDALKLLVPSMNEMIDITTTRLMSGLIHPPRIIFLMLFLLACVASALAGFGMADTRFSWLHALAFILMTVITIYAVLQMEYPRRGFLAVEDYDTVFTDLRSRMQ